VLVGIGYEVKDIVAGLNQLVRVASQDGREVKAEFYRRGPPSSPASVKGVHHVDLQRKARRSVDASGCWEQT
jgi:hypothetical protein